MKMIQKQPKGQLSYSLHPGHNIPNLSTNGERVRKELRAWALESVCLEIIPDLLYTSSVKLSTL